MGEPMKLAKLLRIGAVISAFGSGLVFGGCTQTVIVYKPSPTVSPLPNMECEKTDQAGVADPMIKDQWSLKQLGLVSEDGVLQKEILGGNKNVKIALLSTGVDYNHEDLCGQISVDSSQIIPKAAGEKMEPGDRTKPVVGWNVVENDGFAFDRHGAGTAVAGIIAAKQNNGKGIAGLMTNVNIFPVKYINDNGQTSIPWLVSALDVALKAEPHVIYLQTAQIQIGGSNRDKEAAKAEIDILTAALKRVQAAKIPIVVGAGDSMDVFGAQELDNVFKSFDNVLVITAIDKDSQLSIMANMEPQSVLTAAPGEGVLTTKLGNKYGEVSGTAYAAAHVTAAIGLARATLGERMDYRKITMLLLSGKASEQVPGLTRFTRGGNRLQIAKFVNEVGSL
jgi:subtilisin family serine protease